MKSSLERGGKEKSEGKKRKGKGLMGFVPLFRFVHCVFHSFLSPFQPTMPPHFFSPSPTTLHTTPHHCTQRTRHTTTPVCCCVSCLCVAVFVSHCLRADSTLNQTTQRHGNRPPYMGEPMDEAMSEWEGAVVCVDTTAQTRGTRRK